jgi:hypothetical protein
MIVDVIRSVTADKEMDDGHQREPTRGVAGLGGSCAPRFELWGIVHGIAAHHQTTDDADDELSSPHHHEHHGAGRDGRGWRARGKGVLQGQLHRQALRLGSGVEQCPRTGVSCHVTKASQYDFVIKSKVDGGPGGWIIVKELATGSATVLAHGDLAAASGPLKVVGVCGGTTDSAKLSFQVNGKTVGQVTDADHPLTAGNGGVTVVSDKGNSSFEVLNFAMATV